METTVEDARIARTRAAVREAVRSLFEEEGPAALTHQRVAQRAEVGRATIYRHWPRQVDLITEALKITEQPLLRAGEGPLREWLSRELIRSGADLAQPVARQFLTTVIATADQNPAVAELRDDLLRRISSLLRGAIDRAIAAGETVAERDNDELLAQILGPLIFRATIQRAPVDRAFADRIVDAALGPPAS
ncbi:transcriptional regulator, TetR family [Frankia torreyi]|uniref:Transcriptional regulator, TetR family n=1 Tax=Frankia torreyi TaxID=1856 RepID=A0A0D8BCX6_9ACTN|nr:MULTISPECIES: TetR/AcrR family transcriptional regulator [Frankia]KJE21227.1 transcriptional regulator, TetR family [Frankia torreyi]KQC36209.1 TetR family transcriptional regulator [Frankia sp. ACN1ag]